MKLGFEGSQTAYTSGTQKARAWTEVWVSAWAYSPHCSNAKMSQFPNKSPLAVSLPIVQRGIRAQEPKEKSSAIRFPMAPTEQNASGSPQAIIQTCC